MPKKADKKRAREHDNTDICTREEVPKRKKKQTCPICDEPIVDASEDNPGQDAIFCEGQCDDWLHRQCAGLSRPRFIEISKSKNPFYCPCCLLIRQSEEITLLRSQLSELHSEFCQFKNQFSQPITNVNTSCQTNHDKVNSNNKSLPVTPRHNFNSSSPVAPSQNSGSSLDRKFNLVVYGIPENPKGTSRYKCAQQDLQNISLILNKLESNVASSIRDCFRLGKYKDDLPRPRPLLAKLTESIDVVNILSKRNLLPTNVVIKPDMTQDQKFTQSILLKQRWELIQSGVNRKDVKISHSNIYVKGSKYGQVIDGTFKPTLSSTLPVATDPLVPNINLTSSSPSTAENSSQSIPLPIDHQNSNQ